MQIDNQTIIRASIAVMRILGSTEIRLLQRSKDWTRLLSEMSKLPELVDKELIERCRLQVIEDIKPSEFEKEISRLTDFAAAKSAETKGWVSRCKALEAIALQQLDLSHASNGYPKTKAQLKEELEQRVEKITG